MEEPNYTHDCDRCTFLGTYVMSGSNYDLYYHPGDEFTQSIVARYGEMGPEYISGITFARDQYDKKQGTPMAEAYKRALLRGLFK